MALPADDPHPSPASIRPASAPAEPVISPDGTEPPAPALPPPPQPRGDYVPAVVVDGVAYSAGMTPRREGRLVVRGTVGVDVALAEAAAAAGLAAGNALAAVAAAVGGLDRLRRCLRMTVYVACSEDFDALSAVADGASAVLASHLDAEALPARSAVGVRRLPDGAPVEVELTAAVDPAP